MKPGIGNGESGTEAVFAHERGIPRTNGPLLREAGEDWGGGNDDADVVQRLALAPIRPRLTSGAGSPGPFPRKQGKGQLSARTGALSIPHSRFPIPTGFPLPAGGTR